jgi:hypothetical protein
MYRTLDVAPTAANTRLNINMSQFDSSSSPASIPACLSEQGAELESFAAESSENTFCKFKTTKSLQYVDVSELSL